MTDTTMSVGTQPTNRSLQGAAGQRVWDLALNLLSSVAPGRLLEAAGGGGQLAAQLVERGYIVTGADIVDRWQFPEIPFVHADLDQPLPFDEGVFDVAILVEAIGYLETPSHLLSEFHRIIRPGGAIVITMPNVFSMQSRLRFFLNGTYRWFPHPIWQGENKEDLADIYRDPFRVTTLTFLLERMGFSVDLIEFGGNRTHVMLLPVGWILQGLVRLRNTFRAGKRKQTPTIVNSTAALLRTNVGILARKK